MSVFEPLKVYNNFHLFFYYFVSRLVKGLLCNFLAIHNEIDVLFSMCMCFCALAICAKCILGCLCEVVTALGCASAKFRLLLTDLYYYCCFMFKLNVVDYLRHLNIRLMCILDSGYVT